MAADNDDAYNLTPAFILETVAEARDFISRGGNVTPKDEEGRRRLRAVVSEFLNWPEDRIKNALAQLHAIEEGNLSKEAVEELPTIHDPL